MGSLTSRGRALVVVAFVVSAALCGTSAVALVLASRDDGSTPTALSAPSPTPTPSETPSETPSSTPSAVPTPVFTVTPVPTVTATATPTATSSPRPRTTSSPRPSSTRTAQPAGLFLDAILDPANGTSPGQSVGLFAHATDGDGTISLVSVTWGDGTKSTSGSVTDCAATGTADCKDIVLHHTYATGRSEPYLVTITVASAGDLPESSHVTLKEFVNGPAPEPSPTA